jgi:hypothetical protein
MSCEQVMEATAPVPAGLPKKWRNGRAAATNNPLALTGLSRQAQARRRHGLIKAFVNALGGRDAVGEMAMLQIKKAAELLSLAESVRASMIGDPTRDVTGLVRLEGEARRTLRSLGIKTEAAKAQPREFLEMMRRQRWAAQEQQAKAAQTVREVAQNNTTTEQPPDGTAE